MRNVATHACRLTNIGKWVRELDDQLGGESRMGMQAASARSFRNQRNVHPTEIATKAAG